MYNYNKKGNEIVITSKNNLLVAFYNFDEKGGMIAKNMIEGIKYSSYKRWVKGLEIHRSIFFDESLLK